MLNEDMTEKEWKIWFAGWYEGDACSRGIHGGVYLKMAACSTDYDVLKSIHDRLGGCFYGPKEMYSNGKRVKDRYDWSLNTQEEVIALLNDIMPYLGERRKLDAIKALEQQRYAEMPTQEELFLNKINEVDGCKLWTGYIDKHGFGTCTLKGSGGMKRKQAHKLAFDLFEDYSPPRLINKCGNKNCVDTSHWVEDNSLNRKIHCQAVDES